MSNPTRRQVLRAGAAGFIVAPYVSQAYSGEKNPWEEVEEITEAVSPYIREMKTGYFQEGDFFVEKDPASGVFGLRSKEESALYFLVRGGNLSPFLLDFKGGSGVIDLHPDRIVLESFGRYPHVVYEWSGCPGEQGELTSYKFILSPNGVMYGLPTIAIYEGEANWKASATGDPEVIKSDLVPKDLRDVPGIPWKIDYDNHAERIISRSGIRGLPRTLEQALC
jgi:hypothetical protein